MDKKLRLPGRADLLETPAILLVFLALAACAMMAISSSAGLYEKTVADDSRAFAGRTAMQFLQSKIRRSDMTGSVSVHGWDGTDVTDGPGPVLSLAESLEDVSYRTDLYVHDGMLYEIFTVAGVEIDPENGEKIMPLEGAEFEFTEDGVWIEIRSDGNVSRSFTALRAAGSGNNSKGGDTA